MMDVSGKSILVLGGHGLVGMAVCRALIAENPAALIVASRQRSNAESAAAQLRDEHPATSTRIVSVWGDVLLRTAWRNDGEHAGTPALAQPHERRRLIADFLEPMDEDIVASSLLVQIIMGSAPGLDGTPARIIVDCMNTATAIGYENLYARAATLQEALATGAPDERWVERAEMMLCSLYIPRLVRHMQLLHEGMRRGGTEAYVKVATSGTGGMGLNIPYTHGEERPSRLLMAKAALAGAQTLLTFLMARTPGGPQIVKEIKPAAVIGWREIGCGPIRRAGRSIPLHDCPPEKAVALGAEGTLVPAGDFGIDTGQTLAGVYIDTGENGQFSAAEFSTITALGQMEMVTPEEIAQSVVRELRGGNTGKDVIAALDASVSGPSYRGGFLREAALNRLRELEAEHGEAVAFEILGPPRLAKLLFEAYLLKRACSTLTAAIAAEPEALAAAVEEEVLRNVGVRQRIISIGVPILLRGGDRLLRGPVIKSRAAAHGWVDCTPDNMRAWQRRLSAIRTQAQAERADDTSSRHDRNLPASRAWNQADDSFDIGAIVAWIFNIEDHGRRAKS
jgi:hypothetical protein